MRNIKAVEKRNSYLITGVAGFIGSHLAKLLLKQGDVVVGVDSLTTYYDVEIKHRRLRSLSQQFEGFIFYCDNITNTLGLSEIIQRHTPDIVIHLAAQAGVVVDDVYIPSYMESNILGTECVVKLCSSFNLPLLYASSSSVYGDCQHIPFRESEVNLSPKSLYAETKLQNEQLAMSYFKSQGLRAVGLRFFSVYGEDMRPDMAISKFVTAILSRFPITLYGSDETARDFTYIGDLVYAIRLIACKLLSRETLSPIYNIGNQSPVQIIRVLQILERNLGRKAVVERKPLRLGEAQITFSDTSLLYQHFKFRPNTDIEEGLSRYIRWYLGEATSELNMRSL